MQPELSAMTVARGMDIRPGDRVSFHGDTNRQRRIVSRVLSATTSEIATFVRPSRVGAKHQRRVKS